MQNKIAQYYLQKLAEFFLILIVLTLAIYLLGNAYLTDILHTSIFILLGVYFRGDKNLVTILFIIAIARFLPQIARYFDFTQEQLLTKVGIYTLAFYVCFRLRNDLLAKFSILLLMCMVIAELYWWLIRYDSTPQISYYASFLINDLLVRHFLIARTYCFGRWSRGQKHLPIDIQLYHLYGVFILALTPHVIEYFFRHILNIQTLLIYNVHSYVAYFINVVVIWTVLNYALKKTTLFQA